MLRIKDMHIQRLSAALTTAGSTAAGTTIGTTILDCEVRRYVDTRNLQRTLAYHLILTQRITIPNSTAYAPLSTTSSTFTGYPAMILNSVTLQDPNHELASYSLLDYSPKTLNSAVSTTTTADDSTSFTAGESYASGTSHSQSNTFSGSASLGFFADDPTGDGTLGGASTSSRSSSTSASENSSVSASRQVVESDAMSIKDWGSYAQLSENREQVVWIWGQEYPWNVIKFNSGSSPQPSSPLQSIDVVLPQFVQERLGDSTQALPPSELSLLGVDFVSKAAWLVTPGDEAIPNQVSVNSAITYVTGSHSVSSQTDGAQPEVTATLASQAIVAVSSASLDLPLLALDPMPAAVAPGKAAVVGFMANKFDILPTAADTEFQITADANDLLVRGKGFGSVMSADLGGSGSVTFTVYFKVSDCDHDVTLYLKHWCMGGVGCVMTVVVNGNAGATITRHVDNLEGEGGSVETQSISLRFKDYTSINYCDYLTLGLNEVQITVAAPGSGSYGYVINAIAVA